MSMVGKAFELALSAHRGQTDKAGLAYMGHVARVAASVDTEEQRGVALLHDVVEDCDVEHAQIEQQFGPVIAAGVEAITRREREQPESYYARVRSNPLSLAVKFADLADNEHPARLAMLDDPTRARLQAKYEKARQMLQDN